MTAGRTGRGLIFATVVLMSVTGCARLADSRLNPLNWFGRSQAEATAVDPEDIRPLVPAGRTVEVIDQRGLVDSIAAMRVDRTPYGAIVNATGVAATQGYFNAELVSRGVENGTLTLEFRAERPAGFEAVGSARSRQITAAFVIDAELLAAIRRVRVVGASNSRVSSR